MDLLIRSVAPLVQSNYFRIARGLVAAQHRWEKGGAVPRRRGEAVEPIKVTALENCRAAAWSRKSGEKRCPAGCDVLFVRAHEYRHTQNVRQYLHPHCRLGRAAADLQAWSPAGQLAARGKIHELEERLVAVAVVGKGFGW